MTPQSGATPEQVVMYVGQAVTLVQQAGIPVPALVDLYHQAMWSDFVEVLLWNSAPQPYKDSVIQLLARDESDEDDDDDEEDGEDGNDAKAS